MATPEDPGPVRALLVQRLRTDTPALAPLAERLALAAVHDVTVLLTGETGSGKTHLARLIHAHSSRGGEPLVVVPCGALSPNLLASEFFGHVKGAFTGADRPKVGRFEAAGRGTLLLDEIDTLPLDCQASLLRVLETGEFEPVGGNETRHCQARLIVASNWNLEQAVAEGRFREDLYYRLNVLSFHLPPLRARREDIETLARGMLVRFAAKFSKELTELSGAALLALQEFPWPGNVRQLENALQYAVLVSTGSQLRFEHLPEFVRGAGEGASLPVLASSCPENAGTEKGRVPEKQVLVEHLQESERDVIVRALAMSGYSRSRTARALGISRVTLYKKLKKYGLMNLAARWPALPSNQDP